MSCRRLFKLKEIRLKELFEILRLVLMFLKFLEQKEPESSVPSSVGDDSSGE